MVFPFLHSIAKPNSQTPHATRIILSGQADIDAVMQAINKAEIYRFICKPCNSPELNMIIKTAIEYSLLKVENHRLANIMRTQES